MIFKFFKYIISFVFILILAFIISLYWPRTLAKLEGVNTVLPIIQANTPATKVHFIKTGEVTTLDAFTYAGGSLIKTKTLAHGAMLIEHPKGNVLIDGGLGVNASAQFEADMPGHMKPLMEFTQLTDTKSAIEKKGLTLPEKIILTHAHWDHASGLEDFINIDVLVNAKEKHYIDTHGVPDIFPSQVLNKSFNWAVFEFENVPYGIFDKSYDVYNDGSIVVVPLSGHTPGSVGIFVNNKHARRFFIGDAVWNLNAIEKRRPKMWVSGLLTDNHSKNTIDQISLLHEIKIQNPDLIMIPAHDFESWK
ncbi:MBL fold metallo-hydrolase [Marinicellulosiphila megalodicopiae]|uniref:MBL fold metallo-hydrolase n=1 Tax=Marinicellulosiphila megalodicopiae TaxID=2724896 RepID=UPI003BAF58DE